jgi:cell division transport system permease protein
MARIGLFFRMAVSALQRSWAATLLTVLILSVTLAILGAFGLAFQLLDGRVERLGASLSLSAYLDESLPAAEGRRLAAAVEAWDEVLGARYLSSAAAMEDFRRELGDEAVLLDGLSDDVLPPSVEVELRPPFRSLAGAEAVADRLQRMEGVQEVRYGADRLERFRVAQVFLRNVFVVVGVALLLGTLLIVANTVRLTMLARQTELEVLTLVGATGGFIRTPFLIEGLIQGLLGGSLAMVWLTVLDEALTAGVGRLLGPGSDLNASVASWLGPVVLAGMVLGGIGATLGARRGLRP